MGVSHELCGAWDEGQVIVHAFFMEMVVSEGKREEYCILLGNTRYMLCSDDPGILSP